MDLAIRAALDRGMQTALDRGTRTTLAVQLIDGGTGAESLAHYLIVFVASGHHEAFNALQIAADHLSTPPYAARWTLYLGATHVSARSADGKRFVSFQTMMAGVWQAYNTTGAAEILMVGDAKPQGVALTWLNEYVKPTVQAGTPFLGCRTDEPYDSRGFTLSFLEFVH